MKKPDLYDCYSSDGELLQRDWDVSDTCMDSYSPYCGGCGECVATQCTFYGGRLKKVSKVTRMWRDLVYWFYSFDEDVFRQLSLWSPQHSRETTKDKF